MPDAAWWFTGDPSEFRAVAGEFLTTDPLQFTVMTSVLERAVESGEDASNAGRPYWYAALRSADGSVVSAAMRTAPFVPYPLWLLPMPDGAAVDLARILIERGEEGVGDSFGVNGALPAARECGEALAEHSGGTAEVDMHSRLFRLDEVVWPAKPAARLRTAVVEDVPLVVEWVGRFHADADEQAGREETVQTREFDEAWALDRIAHGLVSILEDAAGTPLHLTARNASAYGVSRIGPVYTPKEQRGNGYAAWTVAQVSADLLEAGIVPCLFTDQANPVSNKVYERIGYTRVVDTVTQTVR